MSGSFIMIQRKNTKRNIAMAAIMKLVTNASNKPTLDTGFIGFIIHSLSWVN